MSSNVNLGEPTFGEEEIEAVREVLGSGWVAGQGPKNRELEAAFADSCGAPAVATVNNCTAGLHLALMAFDVGPGDEVIVADYTFPATGHSVLFTGATPVFADVDPETWCVEPAAVEALVGPNTRGVIAVDALGQCADYEKLTKLTSANGLFLIEDAACSAGATYRGRPSGDPTFADIAVFSLHGRKGITCGEGGVVTSGDAALIERVRKQGAFGIESALTRQGSGGLPIPVFDTIGYNYKLSDIAAAIALVQLGRLHDLVAARRTAAGIYDDAFAELDLVRSPVVGLHNEHTYQSYVLTLDASISRDDVAMALRGRGVGANIGTYASHLQPVYGSQAPCPVSADLFTRHLAIPMHANLTESDLEYVIDAVRSTVLEARS